jgi:UDPglucose 6-dehydrogenase
MNLAVIGTGYVGLVTAAVFAEFGNKVWGLDIAEEKIKTLQTKIIPFYEPGLEDIVSRNIDNGNLQFTTSYESAISQAEVIFICVGTPSKENGDYDLSYVFAAAEQVGQNLKQYAVICIKSTVPPGTADEVKKILQAKTKVPFSIAACPEFLREGSAVQDSLKPSRIILGVEDKKAEEVLLALHKSIETTKLVCDIKSAQLIKYAANAFLATKISFINCIARLCDRVDADIREVASGLGLDPRIGKEFLDAGLGYGGSCFPKDTWALISFAQRQGYDFKFLKEVDTVNQTQIDYVVTKIIQQCSGTVENKIVAILGLSFKPNTDDMREARSIPIIKQLQLRGAQIQAYDPVAMENAKTLLPGVKLCDDPYKAVTQASAIVLVTEWPEFLKLDFSKMAKLVKDKAIIDGRNFLDDGAVKQSGFSYEGVGRK